VFGVFRFWAVDIHSQTCIILFIENIGEQDMATTAELFAEKAAGRRAFWNGETPLMHPSECPGELYEAWYDGWDQARNDAERDD
jgi:hypothetical protein